MTIDLPVRAGSSGRERTDAGDGIRTGSIALDGVLMAVAVAAVAIPAMVVTSTPPSRMTAEGVVRPRRVVPPTIVPEVEPIEYQALAPEDARTFNARVPFATGPRPAARPFRFVGSADDLSRATDCLAAAVLYEAGDDRTGQRAVAQVVLNRLRHPAFPKSVCAVVFQGSERQTGCQFTFTCDGALTRRYAETFWERARAVATAALGGYVFAPVGYATHYHTDWVVPYWQSSLDKIAKVDTHLFFRWTGWWGTPPAFRRTPDSVEPRIVQLAAQSNAHKLPQELAVEQEIAGLTATLTGAGTGGSREAADYPNMFLLPLIGAPDGWPKAALATCGERPWCMVMGWRDAKAVPATGAEATEPEAKATMTFSYFRDRAQPIERQLWNCQQVQRPAAQCMKRAVAPPVVAPAPTATPTAVLPGVRRRAEPVADPAPTPPRS